MWGFIRQHAWPLVESIGLHVVLLALLTFSLALAVPFEKPMPQQIKVEATVVDAARIEQEVRKLEEAERRRAQQLIEEQNRLEAVRKEREQAEAAEKRRKEQLVKDQRARRQAEERQQAEARAKAEAEKKRLAELERQRKAEEERVAALARKREEEERKQREAAAARAKAEAEAQLQQELLAEERRLAAEKAGLLEQYKRVLVQRIERNWVKPPSAQPGLDCVVNVTQIPGGDVVAVKIASCNGDAAVVRSIETAVQRASPLPPPADPTLFARNLELRFRPEG